MGNFVLTLMVDPASHSLNQTVMEALGLGAARLVAPHVAEFDVGFSTLPATCQVPPAMDYILQPTENRRKKLLVADMESTIIRNEFLDELAEFVGKKEEVAAITARAMNGELDFAAALNARVALLEGLPESVLAETWARVEYMPGAHELVSGMKSAGARCMLVSGGFDYFVSRVAAELGFDAWRANRLEIVGGTLTGRVIKPILGKEAKRETLLEACGHLGISPQEALAVGDGANDIPMLLAAGLGVAYHAKPIVQAAAQHRINHADLRALLWAQGLSA